MSKLLVIGGYATSGKDAAANFLVSELGWHKTYMSKPLEQALLTLDPWVPWHATNASGYWSRYSEMHSRLGYDESKKNSEVRSLLQKLGTEVGRNMISENVWLDAVIREVILQMNQDKNVVVTGVRYYNEMEAFSSLGAESLWIHRPGVAPINTHSSDNTLHPDEDFDSQLVNNGTLEDLKNLVVNQFS